jgi:hypothetical protein
MNNDSLVAGVLFIIVAIYLVQRRLGFMIAWVVIGFLVSAYGFNLSHTLSLVAGIVGVYLISMITRRTYENFENDEKAEKNPEPAPPKTDDPHVDIGTTILHAYRNLSPEQIGGMRRDTKELLELQKELMGSLGEMKPAIEQGAELLKTFSTFFGDGASPLA